MNYFSEDELRCKCGCGDLKFDERFLSILNAIRHDINIPLPVSSGYRCANHPIEAKKFSPGAHTTGKAADLLVFGDKAYDLVQIAMKHGIKRIGVSQKGHKNKRFIHLDADDSRISPVIWSY
jgi:uncharacterized protein YcbK (DUF882 family)